VKRYLYLTIFILFVAASTYAAGPKAADPKQVEISTSKGKIVLQLYPDKAPDTVQNFLKYIDAKYYDGTIFHRVIPNFMIQGGGFTTGMQRKPSDRPPIKNEADNGLKNDRGSIAMARTGDPHSATSQFFINTVNNDFLNFKRKDRQGWGYAVFGRVIEGMPVVDAISQSPTGSKGPYRDVPLETIYIRSARRVR
jgi:cyclophilin family peptidyl-prolyl cis-trans isomerase